MSETMQIAYGTHCQLEFLLTQGPLVFASNAQIIAYSASDAFVGIGLNFLFVLVQKV